MNKLRQQELKTLPPGQHFDGGGLFLEVKESGTGVFRYAFRIAGKKRLYTIGWFPDEVSLTAARIEHRRAQGLVDQGVDPVADRKRKRVDEVSATIAALDAKDDALCTWMGAWMDSEKRANNWSPRHGRKIRERITKHLAGERLYKMHLAKITPAEIAPVLEKISDEVPDTAHRIAGYISSTFEYAGSHGRVTSNPTSIARSVLKRRRRSKKERTPQPAILDLNELAPIMLRAQRAPAVAELRDAHVLISYTAQRSERIVSATWDQFNLEQRLWRVPRGLMKTKNPNRNAFHEIYLSDPVIAMLRRLPRPARADAFVFPSEASECGHITIEGLEKFYQRLGLAGVHVPHGWRSALMTNANEAMTTNAAGIRIHRFDPSDSKAVLDHELGDELQRAYDRGERRESKRELLTWWAQQMEAAINVAAEKSLNVVKMRKPAKARAR